MKKRITPTWIMTVVFLSTVFILAVYALGFFTNLLQIRGSARQIYDMYQAYVRLVFNCSLIGIVLVGIRQALLSQLKKKKSVLQFSLDAVLALGVIGVSGYGLLRMGEFLAFYQGLDIEAVRVLYPRYQYDDSVFFIGYIVNSAAVFISLVFLIMTAVRTSWKKQEAAR